MGLRHSALLCLIFVSFFAGKTLFAQFSSDVQPATVGGLVAPVIDEKTDRYMGILYAKKGRIAGYQLQDVRFDFIRKEVTDPSQIQNLSQAVLYPVGSDSRVLVDSFWTAYPHSQLILESDRVILTLAAKNVSGDQEVRLYSPEADLSGDGFSLDYTRRKLEVRDNVRVTIRSGNNIGDSAGRLAFSFTPELPGSKPDSAPVTQTLPPKGSL